MTISSEYAPLVYTAGYLFPFTWPLIAKTDLVVIHVDAAGTRTTLVESTNYTVTGWIRSGDTGSISRRRLDGGVWVNYPLAASESIIVTRDVPYTQPTDLVNQTRLSLPSLEAALDRVTMLAQQSGEASGRALRLPVGETPSDLVSVLPSLAERKGRQLTFDPTTGQPTASNPTSVSVSAAMQPVVAAPTLVAARAAMGPWGDALVTSTGGSASRSLADRFKDIASVMDYGAKGDNVTDDSAAFAAALAARATVYVPPGSYLINSSIVMSDNQRLIGAGRELTHLYAGTVSMTMIKSTKVLTSGSEGGIRISGMWLHGETKATYAIELGARTPTSGNGITCFLEDIYVIYAKNGVRLNSPTFGSMRDVQVIGASSFSDGNGIALTGYTNVYLLENCLASSFTKCVEISGSGVTMLNCYMGTIVGDSWVSNLLSVLGAYECRFIGCAFEHLAATAISEVLLATLSTDPVETFCNTFQDCTWTGLANSAHRIRLGATGGSYKAIFNTRIIACYFRATAAADININSASKTLIDRCIKGSDYYGASQDVPSITYTSGNSTSNNVDVIPWKTPNLSASLTPGLIAAGAEYTYDFTGTAAADYKDELRPTPPASLGRLIMWAEYVGTNTVRLHIYNPTAGGLTPTAGYYNVAVKRFY